MNLKVIFRIDAVVALINGLGLLFMTSTFLEMANTGSYRNRPTLTLADSLPSVMGSGS